MKAWSVNSLWKKADYQLSLIYIQYFNKLNNSWNSNVTEVQPIHTGTQVQKWSSTRDLQLCFTWLCITDQHQKLFSANINHTLATSCSNLSHTVPEICKSWSIPQTQLWARFRHTYWRLAAQYSSQCSIRMSRKCARACKLFHSPTRYLHWKLKANWLYPVQSYLEVTSDTHQPAYYVYIQVNGSSTW